MHLSRIDLNLFVVLDAIYTEQGITRASEKLHLTQPAISHALARLREIFDDPLFVRRGHTMVPTPFARNLIEPVRRSLRSLETTLNDIDRFDPANTEKRFTLGLRDPVESTVLPPLMRIVMLEAPRVDLAAVRVQRRELESVLSTGSLDVAIDVLLSVSDSVRHTRLSADRLVVLARRDHPALARGLDLETYLRLEHILVTTRWRGPGLADMELARLGRQRRVRLRCQQPHTACRIVADTDLLLTISETQAAVANDQFGNQVLPMPVEAPVLDAHLYWHANADTDPANCWLREMIVRACSQ